MKNNRRYHTPLCCLADCCLDARKTTSTCQIRNTEGAGTYDIFKDNSPTKEGFLLGKKLFYDGRLSRDGKFPCAVVMNPGCFATFDHDFSHGFFNGQFTTRNAPSLANLAWQTLL